MYTVRADDLYIGYHFKVQAVMKDGSIKAIPPSNLTWHTCGTIQVFDGRVTYLGEKGDKVIAQVLNKKKQVIASDCIYITDEDDMYDDWEFGVAGLSMKDDRRIVRIKDSKNKDYMIDYVSGRIVTDFDGIIDFGRAKDAEGNEFIKIPTLYRKFNGDQLLISKYPKDEKYEVYPCFINPQNGKILEEIAIGAYKSGRSDQGQPLSMPTVPRVKQELASWKANAQGPNPYYTYFLRNEDVNQLLRDLFVVVFASRSFSTIIKDQTGPNPTAVNTGTTDHIVDLVFSYPKNCCGYDFQNRSFKLFGIEDPFNGGAEWIDGLQNVPELATKDSCCMVFDYKNDDEELDVDNYVQFSCNQNNIKSLQKQEIKNKTYIIPQELTYVTQNYYDNSLFHMSSESGCRNIISTCPSFISDVRYTGLWSYFAVSEETQGYTRLCYYDGEVL